MKIPRYFNISNIVIETLESFPTDNKISLGTRENRNEIQNSLLDKIPTGTGTLKETYEINNESTVDRDIILFSDKDLQNKGKIKLTIELTHYDNS